MRELVSSSIATSAAPPPEALAAAAWQLEPPRPDERRHVLREEAALLVDGLLTRVARGGGALEIALGEGLLALAQGDRTLRLGYSGIGDYARERLGIAGRTAQGMARLARELRERPVLRQAVRRGEVSARKALTILPAAIGDAESEWVGRARSGTVRALEVAVRAEASGGAAGPASAAAEDERFEQVDLALGPEARAKLDEALALAGKVIGAAAPRWQRFEVLCQEFLGEHPVEVSAEEDRPVLDATTAEWFDAAREALEEETACWAALEKIEPVVAPAVGGPDGNGGRGENAAVAGWAGVRGAAAIDVAGEEGEGTNGTAVNGAPAEVATEDGVVTDGAGTDGTDDVEVAGEEGDGTRGTLVNGAPTELARMVGTEAVGTGAVGAGADVAAADGEGPHDEAERLDAELRSLASMRERWDELVGHLAMLLRSVGLWRDMGFATFEHYCAERLGLATRTVEQRAALERRLHSLPALREALREGRVSYEKARLVAAAAGSDADVATVEALIARAERSTCVALRRELEAEHDAQMCARSELAIRVPRRVKFLLDASFRAARAAAGRWLTRAECLVRLAEHFIATWKDALPVRRSLQRRVIERDRGWCQVPGCSRAAIHAHHVRYRSRGGDDSDENEVGTCPAHHLHAIHRGWIRVRGRAPDALRWELGVRRDGTPLEVFGPAALGESG